MLQSFYKVYFISCFCFIAHFLHSQENVQFSYISYVSSSGNIESEYPNTLKLNKNRDLTKVITEQLKTIDSRAYNLLFDNSDQSNNGTLSLVIAVDKERVYTFGYLDKCSHTYFLSTQTVLYNPREKTILASYPVESSRTYVDDAIEGSCNKRDPKLDLIRFTAFYLGLQVDEVFNTNELLQLSEDEIVANIFAETEEDFKFGSVITPVITYINKLNPDNLKYSDFYVGINKIDVSKESLDYLKGKTLGQQNIYFLNKDDSFFLKRYKDWIGQQFVKWFSDIYSYPLVPYAEGDALGRQVNMKFADRDELINLDLPDIEYGFNITLNKPHLKVLLKESGNLQNYIYASYADISFMTDDGADGIIHFTHSIKNGNQQIIVKGDTADDWKEFNKSTVELFYKYIENLSLQDKKYIKTYTTTKQKNFSKNAKYLKDRIGLNYEN